MVGYVPPGMCLDWVSGDVADIRADLAADPTLADRIFHGAINARRADIVSVLIEAGADLNANALGITPLVLAVELHLPDVVHLLITAGADVNLKDESGISPLMAATMPGKRNTARADVLDEEIVQLLKQAGAVETLLPDGSQPVVKRDPYPFGDKLRHADQETLERLLRNAAEGGQIEDFQDLIEVGAKDLPMALLCAIVGKKRDIVAFLLNQGVDPNIDYAGITPLVCATERRVPEIVQMLIAAGADVNKRDGFGITAIEATQLPETRKSRRASHADTEIARFLIEAGSHEPPPQDKLPKLTGRTGFRGDSIRHGNPEGLRNELRIRADWPFMTPAEREEIEDMLAWGDPDDALDASLNLAALPEFLELCIAAGADVNRYDPDSKTTPLVYASRWRRPEVVRVLVEAGADVNLADEQGVTPLMAAYQGLEWDIANGHERRQSIQLETIKYLEERGASQ